ncbi:MAG: NADH-quinone oxidoreductase subunit C [Chloroflexota bacterium]
MIASVLDRIADFALSTQENVAREHVVEVAPDDVSRAVQQICEVPGVSLINVTAADERGLGNGFTVLFSLSVPGDRFISIKATLSPEGPTYPAVSIQVHAADWYERENFDLFGIIPEGHPLPSNLVLHHDWPQGLYPLRKDFPQEVAWPPRVSVPEPPPRATGPGVFQYSVGPVRSVIAEPARFIISSLGEEIADVETRLFWKHRGIEKLCENIPLQNVVLYAERVAANSAIAHSLAFAQAIEAATELQLPDRVLTTRVVLAELERLFNRTFDLGMQAEATGLSVGAQQGAILAEQLRRLNAEVSGHRYLFGSIVPGGVGIDLTPPVVQSIRDYLKRFRSDIRAYGNDLLSSRSHLDRLEDTGIVDRQIALDHAVVGPVARASGLDKDARRDHAYAAYPRLSFEVPVYERGDALARNRVWIDEIFQSISLIEQALDSLQPGDLWVPTPPLPAFASAQGWSEGPRGMVVHRIMANETGTLYRYKIRSASFANWHVFHLASAGSNILTDFPIIERSFALVLASNDR